jgi:hypothetical protein
LEGYTYVYADDREVFRCGNELISIKIFSYENTPEIKALLKRQDEFFMEKILGK